jgi:hypothetical protein
MGFQSDEKALNAHWRVDQGAMQLLAYRSGQMVAQGVSGKSWGAGPWPK